jgi:formylglycine-generating enzyme required for sulfatase activity
MSGMKTWRFLSNILVGLLSLSLVENSPGAEPLTVISNSVGMKLALIPAGEFLMGSPETEIGFNGKHLADESLRVVKMPKPFYMGVHEVTQDEFRRVTGGLNPSYFSAKRGGGEQVIDLDTKRFPVESVSWLEAKQFCERLSAQDGRNYRLPTELEWEYAARSGATSTFHFGDECNGSEANCKGTFPYGTTIKGPSLGRPAPVGSYAPNAFGLYDMHGNVWEMCSDEYDGNRYAFIPSNAPEGREQHRISFVSRGGGWASSPVNCRAAFRYDIDVFHRDKARGLRVVCEL